MMQSWSDYLDKLMDINFLAIAIFMSSVKLSPPTKIV
jgi:hypothetical protein